MKQHLPSSHEMLMLQPYIYVLLVGIGIGALCRDATLFGAIVAIAWGAMLLFTFKTRSSANEAMRDLCAYKAQMEEAVQELELLRVAALHRASYGNRPPMVN